MEEEQMDTSSRILPLQCFGPLLKTHNLKQLLFVTETKLTEDDMNPHLGCFTFPSNCNHKLDLFLLPDFRRAEVTIVDVTTKERSSSSSLCRGGDLLRTGRGDYYLTRRGWTELISDYREEEEDFLAQPRKTRRRIPDCKKDDEEKKDLKMHVWLSYSKTEKLFVLVKFEGLFVEPTTTTTTTTTTERAKKRRRIVDDQAAPLALIEGAKLMGSKPLTKSDVCDKQNRLVLPFPEEISFRLDPKALVKVNEKKGLKVRVESGGKTWWNILRYAERFSLSKMDFKKMRKELQLKQRMNATVYTFSVENEESNLGFKIDFGPAAIVEEEEDPPPPLPLPPPPPIVEEEEDPPLESSSSSSSSESLDG